MTDETGDVARKEDSRQSKSARTEDNIKLVQEIILSLEDQPGTHFTPAEIACKLNINLQSVSRIID